MAMEHTSFSSLAAVADATMAPTSPHGSDEADWDWVDESAAKETEIQRQSDDLRVQEMGATQQLMPLNQAHPGGIAACVERLQIARDAVEQLSPVSSTTGSVLTRLGLEPSQKAVEDVAGASQPLATEAALTAASSAEGEVDVPMTELRTSLHLELRYRPFRASWQLRPRKFTRTPSASRSTRLTPTGWSLRCSPTPFPRCRALFLHSFKGPPNPSFWTFSPRGWTFLSRNQESPGWLRPTTYKKSGLGYSNLKERPAGDQPYERMCAKRFTDKATKCWTCRHEKLVPYSAPSASMDSGKETWHLLFIEGKATWVKDPKSSHRDAPATAGASSPESLWPPTTSSSEVTMADVVPMGMRMSVREEILQMGADDEARALNVKLGEEEEQQSFQLFHPESAREIALQSEEGRRGGGGGQETPGARCIGLGLHQRTDHGTHPGGYAVGAGFRSAKLRCSHPQAGQSGSSPRTAPENLLGRR